MAQDFLVEVFTPDRVLISDQVSEVVLPGFDGKCGVLPGHEDFIGLLGTGPLKIVKGGNDYWFMLSSGVFEVMGGKLTILADLGEEASEIKAEATKKRLSELESAITQKSQFATDFSSFNLEYQRTKARLEVSRRTELAH